ncbi:msx2-interacting protein isoform X2 [Denticeps clupeoides]|uniref:msx2-interacting protein isoform X2 n=1 Tax=Denticeps clupeoides TaxID=299321 RepID=UPI0010A57A62|nr:msx2-interacting protein-like isoform X2 [Denticeps clupeoides]
MVRETRHLWVGNLPEHVREEKIVEHFKRYGRVESVKVLRKRGSEGGVAAFVDFVDIKSAQKAHNAVNKMGDRDLRTDYNEPGSVPSAVRGLEDSPASSSHGRDVSGFSRATVGAVYGPPVSLHTREGRYERRLDGSDSRERTYDHSPYGHHDRSAAFDRTRHYSTDYYRDRAMFAPGVSSSAAASAIGGSFDTPDAHFESRIRDPFTLSSAARRDPYRDDRGRRVDRTYHHRRSRSSHSSQSRHPSPQRTTGQASKQPHSPKRATVSPSRGPRSQSRSRSSSSDSVSSTSSTGSGSSDSNSSSSERSRTRSVQSAATHPPPAPPPLSLDSDEPRRSFGIKVQNLPVRSTDTSLKDGLFHEFKKYGKVTSVQIHGASEERYGLVFFRQQEDQEKALSVSKGKLFFGMLIEVTAWNGPETESENEFRPLDGRIDEFHPKATRTLFIGNLEKTTNYQQLLDVFQRFGEIVDIDIKRVNGVPQYAFVQYSDIASVCKAIKKMDGEYLGANRLKLGFGKSMPTSCVWLDGLASNITEQYLTRHFCRYGHVVKVVFDRLKGMALILYNNTDFAQAAVRETKGWKIGGNKIKVDFASQESQMAFYRSMQASGQDIRDFYEIQSERREDRRPPYHDFTAERAYYENVRAPGLYAEDPRRDYPARSRDRYAELEHYQGEHYDPRFHEDPREYRDYRDPFEQDIRKYSYIQRERERERERFEADRSRWSPSHQRRPITPSASSSPSERVPREAERRVYRHSSERSGSCSSLSPPPPAQFEKLDKSPVDYKPEERDVEAVELERVGVAERGKRVRRKDKGDKEKGEKTKSRRAKVPSPATPHSETDKEATLDSLSKVKVLDVDTTEKQRHKGDMEDSTADQLSRSEPQKSDRFDQGKGEASDRDGKTRQKKHNKSDSVNEGKDLFQDSDRLAARKRRFGEPSGKGIRQKRGRIEEENPGLVLQSDSGPTVFAKEPDGDLKGLEKEAHNRDQTKMKPERLVSNYSQKDEQHPGAIAGRESSSAVRQGEPSDVNTEVPDPQSGPSVLRLFSHDGSLDQDNKPREDYMSLDIDLSQSYRKQMEQNRKLRQQLQEPDKQGKPGSPPSLDSEDFEHCSLVHEVGKPPQDVTDNSPSSKKKQESFESEQSSKRERVYRTFRPKSEDPEWNNSPRLQHPPQHPDEDFLDMPHLMTVKDLKQPPKHDVHPELELSVKRVHTTQMSKLSTSLHGSVDEQHKRWESRLKQEVLPDLNFSSAGRKRLNRKHLDYGLWHDLEPGEVRSDSEEDREHKSSSPVASTSVSLPERQRMERLSDSKIATSLERNKFYSFALDQTITPDTKALLERAKSLSSSREDNWSFLDYDSHFASFRSRKDTEKVETAPRPTPSWYMKKKKIRSESEDKLDERKEDPKPEEQERRELFASRFLHSSIFEQDSRRLQHLERKHEDPEHGLGYNTSQQGPAEGQLDPEPVVLFHSRFLELTRLQQQKDKEQSQQEAKKSDVIESNRSDKSPEGEQHPQLPSNVHEPVSNPDINPVSPLQIVPVFQGNFTPKEIFASVEKSAPQISSQVSSLPSKEPCDPQPVPRSQPVHEAFPVHNSPKLVEINEVTEVKEVAINHQPEVSLSDIKDVSKPYASSSEVQFAETLENSVQPKPEADPELPTNVIPNPAEDLQTSPETPATPMEVASQVKQDDQPGINSVEFPHTYSVGEPVSPPQKSKSKKNKAYTTAPAATVASPSSSDKQATRKSERIDREKLKRGSSPRGETSKNAGKSPVQGVEAEHNTEQSISLGRTRRRNVRSVYATPVEDEPTSQAVKDAESPRPARKRGGDKDSAAHQTEQESLTTPRRGRPPKNRRQGDDSSTVKGDRTKSGEPKELDNNDLGNIEAVGKTFKSKNSPPKVQMCQVPPFSTTAMVKKGDKEKAPENVTEQLDTSAEVDPKESTLPNDSEHLVQRGQKKEEHSQQNTLKETEPGKVYEKSSGNKAEKPIEPVTEEQPCTIYGRSKGTRLSRNTKLATEDKSLGLKNLRIRLDLTEVKAMLQSSEEEPINEHLNQKNEVHVAPKERGGHNVEREMNLSDSKITLPSETVLSRQIELQQAVENIVPRSPQTEPSPTVLHIAEDPEPETEEEKPVNPASDPELVLAINSITSDMSCTLPQELVLDSEQEAQPFSTEPDNSSPSGQEELAPAGTPRKGTKGRLKIQKKSKSQKPATGRKDSVKDGVLDTECTLLPVPDSVGPESQTDTSASTAAMVITVSPKQKVNVTDISKVSEEPPKYEPDPLRVTHTVNKSPTLFKPQQHFDCAVPSLSPTGVSLKSSHNSRVSLSPSDQNQLRDAGIHAPVTSVIPKESPVISPDGPDPDSNSSDLRKILMKAKNISVASSVPGNLRENPPSLESVVNKPSLIDSRQTSLTAQPMICSSSSLSSTEPKQIFGEKAVISVIASTATSVISRICNPTETEEKAKINPLMEKPLPKQVYQPKVEDSGTYHGSNVGDDGGNAGRFVVESGNLTTGPSLGLRVNTSEGVVVLSHSGQKIEGKSAKVSAKISPIPPASPADMESQQLVSMPQIKPELYTQTPTAKGSVIPSDIVHSLKAQSSITSKQENVGLDKKESAYQSSQSGVVKRLPQTGSSQVMGYHLTEFPMVLKHPKKGDGSEPLSDGSKPWPSAISPAISPHLTSPSGNHVPFNPPSDRASSHLGGMKEPRSPRKSGHPHSPFTKGSSSPKGMPVMIATGIPTIPQYVHHSEQSVIMPPHSSHATIGRLSPHRVSQAVQIGHLSQGDVRVNTPPLAMLNYGIHSDPLGSPWSGPPQQRSASPQAVGNRDVVMKVNPGSARSHETVDEESRRFHQVMGRPSAPPLKPESLQPEYRAGLSSALQLDRYNMQQREMRILMHHQQGERPATELHLGNEGVPSSSAPTSITASLSPRAHLLGKGMSDMDSSKPVDVKRPSSPVCKDAMIRGTMSAIASPQRVPIHQEYQAVYTNIRGVPQQFVENPPLSLNQPPLIASSQASQDVNHSQLQNDTNLEQVGYQSVDMVQLLTKYPIIWQGLLALKNDTVAVQLHFVCGNKALALRSLPLPEGGALLRIVQRMRLEASQLESVARRMTGESEFCLLLAMPCGRDQDDVVIQSQALRAAFINYLQAKLAAGIINVPNPGSNQPAYVLQIFPPCEFSESHLSRLAPDLFSRISSISPQHLMIVITSV